MRKNVVGDCNVAVVANGRNTHASWHCQLACISELERIVEANRVAIDKGGLVFEELPPNSLDPDDRKFLAVAIVAQAPILNATDTDWNQHADLLDALGVTVDQLCPEYAT